MRTKAEDWLAQQEVALLAAIYQLEPAPEPVDPRQATRLQPQTVRVKRR